MSDPLIRYGFMVRSLTTKQSLPPLLKLHIYTGLGMEDIQ